MVDARCPVVVGRDAEIAVLRGVLAAAREGRGGLAVLTGMPGVGKSRLLTDLVGSARHDGWIVATDARSPDTPRRRTGRWPKPCSP